jgi:hypothetical protein
MLSNHKIAPNNHPASETLHVLRIKTLYLAKFSIFMSNLARYNNNQANKSSKITSF